MSASQNIKDISFILTGGGDMLRMAGAPPMRHQILSFQLFFLVVNIVT